MEQKLEADLETAGASPARRRRLWSVPVMAESNVLEVCLHVPVINGAVTCMWAAAAHVSHSTGVEQADLEIKVEASLMETGPRNAHPFHMDGPHQPLILF